ncbi:MAG: endolytic transglycosylase MltG [Acidobacteriia bacterium]|nr:endolytic transglycosylase MltG [Terriglobia bacterium]MBV8904611.1 endolytic transglycosylase MltG [Terriglobia bacterium]
MKLFRVIAVLFVLAVVGAGFVGYRLSRSYRGFSDNVFLEFPRGTSAEGIANMLEQNGVVRSRWDFLLARVIERGRTLQAGEYRFNSAASPLEIYDRIARGDVFYYELTVPEGFNLFDIGAAVEKLGLFPQAKFVAAARNPAMIRDLDPMAPTLEGYLFPNSYRLSRKTTPERLCRIMTEKFREVWKSVGARANVHDTVTLASLVEKEGKLAEERPLIAAVFQNRLRIGMKLDCDPTTIYAAILDNRYRGTIYRSDLDSDNPYNTYRRAGLPPGPIANPGLASLRAVLQPADSEALYFVLRPDGAGAHQFSKTIAEHEAATARYRRGNQR